MEKTVKVQVRNISVSPYKARLVADLVRGMEIEKALDVLKFLNKKAALHLTKAFNTGIANAKDLLGLDVKSLKIAKLTIEEGKKGRGVIFQSRGRVSQLVKRKSHINLELKAK
jgi:large subunit ribosomal protein L22